tara:strand:- start:176 stop:721 length:546 start_codon:yes stop_codon:yes gene_type:complete
MDAVISSNPDTVRAAERIIFPGVGAAGSAMQSLRESGMNEAILEFVREGKPVFGICLGLQISMDYSEENNQETLGLLAGNVQRFDLTNAALKIPHMGWNSIVIQQNHHMLEGVKSSDEFYFVHSYYSNPTNVKNIFGITHYGNDFVSVVAKENYFATQFHPEKSGKVGLRMLSRFATWDGD